jgi:hypothetical protein
MNRSERTANEWLAEAVKVGLVPTKRIIPSWQVASTCKRSRKVSFVKRIARMLGL